MSDINKTPQADWRQPPEPIAEELYRQTYEADIVIVGAGQSGTAAARSAAEAGASVIVIEAQKEERQRILGGRMAAINSAFGRERDVPQYEPTNLVAEIMRRNQYRPNAELIRQYAEHGGETFDWFIEPLTEEQKAQIGVFFNPPPKHTPERVGGYKWFVGSHLMPGGDGSAKDKGEDIPTMTRTVKINQQVAKDKGAQFFFSMSGEQLLKDGDRVIGVAGKDADGNYVKFLARKGVILAAGDFSANVDMVTDLLPEVIRLNDGKPMRGMGWDGKGIRMGYWAGGALDPGPIGAEGGSYVHIGSMFCGVLNVTVNIHGKRFCDECNGRVPAIRQPGDYVVSVWDSNWRERLEYQPVEHGAADPRSEASMALLNRIDEVIGTGRAGGKVESPHPPFLPLIYSADTYEELGDYLGFEGENLTNFVETMNNYNKYAYQGYDEEFGKDPSVLLPHDKPPYFACKVSLTTHMAVTSGGLWIDANQQVLGAGRKPIPGLYATGNCSGQRFGVEYYPVMSGQSVGMAQTLGRILGNYLATL